MPLRFFLFFGAAALAAQVSAQFEGVTATQQGRLDEAISAFERAVQADPSSVPARLHLAGALLARHPPGTSNPEAGDSIRRATDEFNAVLRLQPENQTALEALGAISFRQAHTSTGSERDYQLTQAEQWYRRLTAANPTSKSAWYSLGVIAWSRAYPAFMEARTRAGMRPEEQVPLRDASARSSLRGQFGHVIQEGIAHLRRAIEIDPGYGDAMAYMNLLHRLNADLSDTQDDYSREIAAADLLVQRALEAKKRAGATSSPGMIVAPPPPPPVAGSAGPTSAPPKRIRVGGNVQAAKLIRSVPPVYPPLALQARIQGIVRFNTTIGRDGRVADAALISGHPLMVPAAQEAIKQYEYQSTLLNGEPVEVVTQVDVPFTLPQ